MSIGVISAHDVLGGGVSGYAAGVLADNPLGYWRHGEPSGTTMLDSSGNSRDGTYTGVTLGTAGLVTGDSDTAGTYNTASTRADVPYGAWMNSAALSLDGLIKPTSMTFYHVIIARDGATTRGMMLRISNTAKLQWEIRNSGGTLFTVDGATTLSPSTKYHIGARCDGSTIKVYVNGVEDGSAAFSGSLFSNTLGLQLGLYDASGGTLRYGGILDEMAYYGTALSGARFAAHAAAA